MKLEIADDKAAVNRRTRQLFIRSCCVAAIVLLAAVMPGKIHGQEAEYMRIYEKIQKADSLAKGPKFDTAVKMYREAYSELQQLHIKFRSWKPELISYRLDDVAGKLAALDDKLKSEATSANSGTQPVDKAQKPVAPPETKAPEAKSTLTLLEPGAEPREVLRLQPKAGDKQLVAFTMKLLLEPGMTNLPLITVTMQITTKNVSANGDIEYERLITDVSVAAAPDSTLPDKDAMQKAFSVLKGQSASGVISSRGIRRKKETSNRTASQQLPPIVGLAHNFVESGLDLTAVRFPEEPIGPGAKWEVKAGDRSRDGLNAGVYEIVSIENNHVTTRATFTMTEFDNVQNPGMTGGGSGETMVDLARILPVKGQIVYHAEGLGPDGSGKTVAVKIGVELRIESK